MHYFAEFILRRSTIEEEKQELTAFKKDGKWSIRELRKYVFGNYWGGDEQAPTELAEDEDENPERVETLEENSWPLSARKSMRHRV